MNITSKQAAVLELLSQTGIGRSNYETPMLRFLWRMGFDAPPPHFASFWRNLICSSAPVCIGAVLGQFLGKVIMGTSIAVFWPACAAGLGFGFFTAVYYAYGARKHRIPRWHAFHGI